MKRILFFATLVATLTLMVPVAVWAQGASPEIETNIAVVVLDLLVLLVSLLCCLFAAQLYMVMKGGEMMFAWRFLAAGALLYAISKTIEIADAIHFTTSPTWLIPGIRLIFIVCIMLGFMWQKKALS